jgi:hypothetical protein
MHLESKFRPLLTFHWFVIDLNVNFYFHRVVQPWNWEFVSHEILRAPSLHLGKFTHTRTWISLAHLPVVVITFHAHAISVEFVEFEFLKIKSFNFFKEFN